ncbi:MAG: hypothetical protein GY839_17585 [candidate division Zixibacteria bacterium]|nr:hypothetical protein [candidate division Zixibacteria bacterium]
MSNNRLYQIMIIFSVIILITAAILFIPMKLPYTVTGSGKIMPSQRWALVRGNDGQLLTSMVDYKSGLCDGYSVLQFAREGAMNLSIDPAVINRGNISKGDTVGAIYSSETEESLAELEGQLAGARALLAVEQGGRKESVIREFEQRLIHAQDKASEHQKILNRLKSMVQGDLISQQEYEISLGQARLLDIEISIAESQLAAVKTGDKPEQIELIKAQIKATQNDLDALYKRIESFSIISPLNGKISRMYTSDTLLVVSDTSSYVAIMPVEWKNSQFIKRGQTVDICPHGSISEVKGVLLNRGDEVQYINGHQVVVATILLEEISGGLKSGMLTKCNISCEPLTLLEHIVRFVNSVMA